MQQAAQELGDLVKSALRAVNLLESSPRIAFAGGLFRENSLLSFLLETRLNGDIAGAAIVKGGDEPCAARCGLRSAWRVERLPATESLDEATAGIDGSTMSRSRVR